MANYQIPISYVVSASAVLPQAGLEPLKLSTILILTDDEPVTELTGDYEIYRTVTSAVKTWGTESTTTKMIQAIFGQSPNILNNNGYVIVAPYKMIEPEDEGEARKETYSEAILRLSQSIYFNGILTSRFTSDSELVEASNTVEALQPNRILFAESSNTSALTVETGLFYQLLTNNFTKTLLYTTGTNAQLQAKIFASAYASKLFSVNYNGSNTCITMNLKDLSGIVADTNISESVLAQCVACGCDVYASVEGLPKVLSNRKGSYYADQIQNQIWFVNTIQRTVFNLLATTRTKIPQTEGGMQIITNAISEVCNQAIINGYGGAGKWNSADTFGDYEDFHRNIFEQGFYIYHLPVAQQIQSEREERRAPMFQIALKEAGAVHSANILIYVEP